MAAQEIKGKQMVMRRSYDYVIVGAGSAGCVLANRLTQDEGATVLLIEAGGRDLNPLIHIPLGMGKMHEYGMHDWGYHTEPEPNLNNRTIEAARGKVLGGSSSINVMAYTRGHRGDYDRWAQKGCKGWSYADILPYFKRGETFADGGDAWRGGDGPLQVQFASTRDPLFDAWVEAARATGLPVTDDYNGQQNEGFGRSQYTIGNGKRSSSAVAYLHPARKRPNLTVDVRAQVTRVMMSGTHATGVEYVKDSLVVHAEARKEVILASGTFNTPQLLMLSGIGPAAHLREMGVAPVVDLPVGENLQDHLAVLIMFTRPQNQSAFRDNLRFDRMAFNMLRAHFTGTGPGTVVPGGLHAFIKTNPELAVPDIEFMFRGLPTNAHLWFPGVRPAYEDGYGIHPALLHPDSRGKVLLRSSDPLDTPRIMYNFFSASTDLPKLREGFKIAREVAYSKPMDPYRGVEKTPGDKVKTDAEIDAWIRKTVITAHHPAGTCAMGIGPDSVLDPTLRVRGVEGLRVVDASAMPDMVGAHINACVLMMAEKAADMIRGQAPLPALENA